MQVITGLTVGGAQDFLLSLLREIRDRDYEWLVVGLYPGSLRTEFERSGIDVVELEMRRAVHPPTWFHLRHLMREFRPHIVHTHLGKADNYGRVAASTAGAPVIVSSVHNFEDWWARPLLRSIDRLTLRFADVILAGTEDIEEHLRASLKYQADIRVLPYGIALSDAGQMNTLPKIRRKVELGLPPDARVMTMMGRLEAQKGHIYGLRAAAVVRRECPALQVLVAGDGSLAEDLQAEVRRLGAEHYVQFLGVRRDLDVIFGATDVFVMPSLWEGLPIALLRAMAARMPIVATSVGSIPRAIEDNVTGLLVSPKDIRELAKGIAACFANEKMASRLGEAAQTAVHDKYDIRRSANCLHELYEELLLEHVRTGGEGSA